MNNGIAAQCEQSFYEELYHYGDGKRCLVMDRVSGHIYMRKMLNIYRVEVFQYLMEHQGLHIPRIHTIWKEDNRLIVIEELISGVGLDYALENVQMDRTQRLSILRQLCDGLAFLHSAHPQIIHRDLKPSNVMVTDDGIVKIIDYDAAKPLDDAQNKDTVLIGTRGSAAPEQYGFGKCDERTDIYGLGGIIRTLFPEDPQMQQIADKATRLDPASRYQTIQELAADLPGNVPETIGTENKAESHKNNAPETSFLHRLCQVPGFRTREPWRMIVAVMGYLMIGAMALGMDRSTPSAVNPLLDTWLFRITVLGAMLSIVDVFMDWTGVFSRFPLVQNPILPIQFAGRCLTAFVTTICWALLYALVASVLGL